MSPLAIIFVTVFIDLIGFGIIIPLLPFYAESYGASALTIGLLGSVFSLMQFVFSPIWGRWSDRIGRRPIILMGLVGSAVSYLALAQAESLALIFLARIIGGIAGANVPTAQAYIADITTPENRAKGLGLVGVAFGLGFGSATAGLFMGFTFGPTAFAGGTLVPAGVALHLQWVSADPGAVAGLALSNCVVGTTP